MKRSLQLDFFRGVFLILILVDHYLTWDNLIRKFTHEFIGWVSAAEAFVFISGLTAGLVFSRKYLEKGGRFIAAAARKRAWVIYKNHMLLILFTLVVLLASPPLQVYWKSTFGIMLQDPLGTLSLATLLLYQPLYLDILPMYAVFVLFIPLLIRSFHGGRHWQLLAASFVLYLIGTFGLVPSLLPNLSLEGSTKTGFFNLFCWQFLFVAGLFLGFLDYRGKTEKLRQSRGLLLVALLIIAPLFYLKLTETSFAFLDMDYWTEKGHLRPLRLLNFSAFLIVAAFLSTRFGSWFAYRPVCYLGRHSLHVFSFHIVLLVLFRPLGLYLNSLYAIRISETTYIYPWGTLLLPVLVAALYLAPVLLQSKSASLARLKKTP